MPLLPSIELDTLKTLLFGKMMVLSTRSRFCRLNFICIVSYAVSYGSKIHNRRLGRISPQETAPAVYCGRGIAGIS